MSVDLLDALDKEILDAIQKEIPLVPEPFKVMAKNLGTTEEELMARLEKMKGDSIRQISAICDTKALGYKSSLVAARIAPDKLDEMAVKIFNSHPGITHNYKRNHDFNLWFTIALPPNSRFGLEKTVEILGELSNVESIRILPTLKLFKIGVQLDVKKEAEANTKSAPTYTEEMRQAAIDLGITDKDIKVIIELQKDLPIVSRPFDEWAKNAGMTTEELLNHAKVLVDRGQMRRFSAVLNHRKAGFRANGMGVWNVPAEQAEEVGMKMGSFRAVSHCYLRPTYPDWKYSIFTMVHGRDKEECESILQAIEDETGITDRITLYSTKEYKKTRVSYFTPEIYEWENEMAAKLGLDK
ncbi:Lrp/AsnC family transcriptional regulator [Brevibacillus halotolerans]|uniref:siroheme decarboxylase subunit alpha n=1 Tax=Brevibacillus halotolerans TaxID=1507437 RepID=UPI0015EED592|nr:Lrp/AsnC family transcriptional regulator [Brevibacillus halotolerans]MBA4531222.1 Lrp/AsnC family transcriptional regulator [Brevibacillus halotolerans]